MSWKGKREDNLQMRHVDEIDRKRAREKETQWEWSANWISKLNSNWIDAIRSRHDMSARPMNTWQVWCQSGRPARGVFTISKDKDKRRHLRVTVLDYCEALKSVHKHMQTYSLCSIVLRNLAKMRQLKTLIKMIDGLWLFIMVFVICKAQQGEAAADN